MLPGAPGPAATGYGRAVVVALRFLDDEGSEVDLDAADAAALLSATGGLEGATVSACSRCRSRVLAAVALVDLLDAAPPLPRTNDLVDLADDAPTLHVFVVDESSQCRHESWLDPLFGEWAEAVGFPAARPRR